MGSSPIASTIRAPRLPWCPVSRPVEIYAGTRARFLELVVQVDPVLHLPVWPASTFAWLDG